MTQPEKIDIAMIGTRNQVALTRLAGVEKYRIIDDDEAAPENIEAALLELFEDSSVGIIMIPEMWAADMTDTLKNLKGRKRRPVVVIEIPSGFTAKEQDVTGYYEEYTKRLIGFNVDL
jgi:vacuolar-type H+-ATPase subunit F/Vma7